MMIEPSRAMASLGTEKEVIFGLQVLRGVAALLVLLRHSSKFAISTDGNEAFGVGQTGVDIFFVVSGFVMYMTGRDLTWHRFLRRRLARVVPLYWLLILIAMVAALVGIGPWPPLYNLIASLFFIPALDQNGDIYPVVAVGWTLNFEMYFYIVFAAALMLAPPRWCLWIVSAIIIAGIGAGALLFWAQGAKPPIAPLILLLPISIEFVAGMWLARLWLNGFRTPLWSNGLLILAAVVWFALAPIAQPYTPWRPLAWGVPSIAIVWATLASENKIAFGHWRPLLLLGDASYSLYLFHPIVLAALRVAVARLDVAIGVGGKFAVGVGLSLVVAVVAHLLIEQRLVRAASWALRLRRPVAKASLASADMPNTAP